MIHVKDHKTRDTFNPFEHLGPKRLALLESSWAHLFREEILHKFPAEKLFPLYSEEFGRKTKELYTMLGIILIQQMEDLTDEEAVHQFAFNIMWHYALNGSLRYYRRICSEAYFSDDGITLQLPFVHKRCMFTKNEHTNGVNRCLRTSKQNRF